LPIVGLCGSFVVLMCLYSLQLMPIDQKVVNVETCVAEVLRWDQFLSLISPGMLVSYSSEAANIHTVCDVIKRSSGSDTWLFSPLRLIRSPVI
jgi:hypothetical protein